MNGESAACTSSRFFSPFSFQESSLFPNDSTQEFFFTMRARPWPYNPRRPSMWEKWWWHFILFYFAAGKWNVCPRTGKKRAPIFGGSDDNNSAGGGEMENWRTDFFSRNDWKKGNAKKKERIFREMAHLKSGNPRDRGTLKKITAAAAKKSDETAIFFTSHFPPHQFGLCSTLLLPEKKKGEDSWIRWQHIPPPPPKARVGRRFSPKEKMNKTKAHLNFLCQTNSLLPLVEQIKKQGQNTALPYL